MDPGDKFVLWKHLAACELRHRGLSIDVGSSTADSQRNFQVGQSADSKTFRRGGSTFGQALSRKMRFDFWLDEAISDILVQVKVRGTSARKMWVRIDRTSFGAARLKKGETSTLSFHQPKVKLEAGRHVITFSFSRRPRGTQAAYAEIDWVRIGVPDKLRATYAPPTHEDVIKDVPLDNTPMRSLVLRAPGAVRCPLQASSDATLELGLGYWGRGKGEAAIRFLRDGEEPVVLLKRRLSGGPGATWQKARLDLGKYAGQPGVLELRALKTTRGGRIAFGDATIVRKAPREERIKLASSVIVAVFSAIDRRRIPPWGSARGLPNFASLAKAGAVFNNYRTPTTVPAGVMASLLTSLPPRAHALEDPAARLPAEVQTVAELVKEAGGQTAMFSGAPTSFSAFGFNSGWDEFQALSPVHDIAAAEPLTRATRWLAKSLERKPERRLLWLHLRGAHPPWDVTKTEASRLAPKNYEGSLEPRRGGVIIGNVRRRHRAAQRRLTDEDWIRKHALERASLKKQDRELGGLIRMLKEKERWNDTLLIVVGDVAPGEGPEPPYDPEGRLRGTRLLVPLLIKFPSGIYAGREIQTPVTSQDIATTVLHALGLRPLDDMRGGDLLRYAAGIGPVAGRAIMATRGDDYVVRWGRLALRGRFGKIPALCRLDLDPSCTSDQLTAMPLAAQAIWQRTYLIESQARTARQKPREAASIDPATGAALTVWGDI